MHIRRREQGTIFDAVLVNLIADPEALRMDAELARVDDLLDDAELVATVHQALGRRRPKSRTTGRQATPSEVVLRMLVLKHLRNWSYDTLEREVRANLSYRQFTRIGTDKVPDAKSLIKIAGALGEKTIREIHERVVEIARDQHVVKGRKLRVDTTVVETNIRYPTDSRLLADAIRVMTRIGNRMETEIGCGRRRLRNRLRSAGRRVLEIALSARSNSPANEAKRKRLYQRLLGTTRSVMREAEQIVNRARRTAKVGISEGMKVLRAKLGEAMRVARRIVEQTRSRVLRGDVHHENKVLSVFETHSEAIRKGKAAKPTEFGKMVKIQEAERQIVTDYQVEPRRIADSDLYSVVFRCWSQQTQASTAGTTNWRRSRWASGMWLSQIEGHDRRKFGSDKRAGGFGGHKRGEQVPKGGSASSSAGTDWRGVDTGASVE